MLRPGLAVLLSSLVLLVVPTRPQDPAPHENLNAVLWMQTSAEYRAAALQAWNGVRRSLPAALGDAAWTSALEQSATPGFHRLPPAVIVDIDETVLDNGPYQARLVADGATFSPETWKVWVEEENARPVPGALRALSEISQAGVTVFYVSNRTADLEDATRRNLARFGFPLDPRVDTVLLKNEQEGWGSDKTPRRGKIAASYRIVMQVGDDLGDFVPGARGPLSERRDLIDEFRDSWGARWHVIPNPTYGSWLRALAGFRSLDREKMIELERSLLDTRRPK